MYKLIVLTLIGVTLVHGQNQAIVVLTGTTGVNGTITFKQTDDGVLIEGSVSGLSPGNHGFHVHSKGDLTDGCLSTGSHFNPFNQTHGGPTAAIRHVGDLGNIEADANGYAKIDFTDKLISLKNGDTNILGRAIVVHTGEDDLGLGNHTDSLTTGNAGGRLVCGIIGVLSEEWNNAGSALSANVVFTAAVIMCSFLISRLQ